MEEAVFELALNEISWILVDGEGSEKETNICRMGTQGGQGYREQFGRGAV